VGPSSVVLAMPWQHWRTISEGQGNRKRRPVLAREIEDVDCGALGDDVDAWSDVRREMVAAGRKIN
jgi:hypothetical protein